MADLTAIYRDDATEEEILACYQALIDSGEGWKLEGSVGRSMMAAIEAGQCMLGPKPARDFWGNLVPAWWMVEPGTVGSPEHADRERPGEPSAAEKDRLCRAIGLERRAWKHPAAREEPKVDGETAVVLRRLDAFEEAIRQRESWERIEWHYDHVRSAVERALGTRQREVDGGTG